MAKGKKVKLSLEDMLVSEKDIPYEVPKNWVWTRLKHLTKIIGGGTPSSTKIEYFENGEIPWITPADLTGYNDIFISRGRRNITELGLNKSSARLMPKGTVLLSSRAPIGYVVIANNDLSTNQGFKSFLPSLVYLPKYLYFFLKANKGILESYASGTTFLELSGKRAGEVEIPVAPLREQQQIIYNIESLFEKLDRAKELIQNVLDSFENRKAAILHKAFTGDLTEKWRKTYNFTMKQWKIKKLKDISVITMGQSPKGTSYNTDGVGTPLINGPVEFGDSHFSYTIKSKWTSSPTKICHELDLLMCVRGSTTGRTNISSFEACIGRGVASIRAKYYQEYVNYFIHFNRKNILLMGGGSMFPNISKLQIENIEIPFPTIEEQKEIVKILDKILTEEQQAKDLCNVLDKIELMKKSILSKAFRGELGTNNPEEESAIELLKEIIEKNN